MKKITLLLVALFISSANILNAQQTGANGPVNDIIELSDNKIIIVGDFTTYNGVSCSKIIKINSLGTIESNFQIGTGFNGSVNKVIEADSGKIIVVGNFTSYNGNGINRIARLNANGTFDPTFSITQGADDVIRTIVKQTDGKYLIGGAFLNFNGTSIRRLARLNNNGTLDATFVVGNGPNSTINTIVSLSNGDVLIGGGFTTYKGVNKSRVALLNSVGTMYTGFNVGTGPNGVVRDLTQNSDGTFIVAGSHTSYNGNTVGYINKIDSNGNFDNSFTGTGTNNLIYKVIRNTNNTLTAVGDFSMYNGVSKIRIVRFSENGNIDNTLNSSTGADAPLYSIIQYSNGSYFVGGGFYFYSGTNTNRIANINFNGSLNNAFNPPPSISIAITNGTNPTCLGGLLTFTATSNGGNPTYQWFVNGVPSGSNNASFTTNILSNNTVVSCSLTTLIGNAYSNEINVTTTTMPTINNPTTTAVTQTSAVISWNVIGSPASTYAIYYRDDASNWKKVNTTQTTYTLNNLLNATNYRWYVQAVCGANVGPKTTTLLFTTLSGVESCVVPYNLVSSNLTSSSVTLSWAQNIVSDSYRIQCSGNGKNYHRTIAGNIGNFTDITGLEPGVTYQWRVASICNGVTGTYSSLKYFTTPSQKTAFRTHKNLDNDGTEDLFESKKHIEIYPNPVINELNIALSINAETNIQIIDILGKILIDETFNNSTEIAKFDLSNFKKGIYLIRISSKDEILNSKIIKE